MKVTTSEQLLVDVLKVRSGITHWTTGTKQPLNSHPSEECFILCSTWDSALRKNNLVMGESEIGLPLYLAVTWPVKWIILWTAINTHNQRSGKPQQARPICPSPSGVPNKGNALVLNTEYGISLSFLSFNPLDGQCSPQSDTSSWEKQMEREERENMFSGQAMPLC